MLRREYRLRRSSDIDCTRRQGRPTHHSALTLYARRTSNPTPRFAVVTSKRLGNAVVRNRLRRQILEAIRLRLAEIPVGWDLLIVVKKPQPDLTFQALSEGVESVLSRGLRPKGPPEREAQPATDRVASPERDHPLSIAQAKRRNFDARRPIPAYHHRESIAPA